MAAKDHILFKVLGETFGNSNVDFGLGLNDYREKLSNLVSTDANLEEEEISVNCVSPNGQRIKILKKYIEQIFAT